MIEVEKLGNKWTEKKNGALFFQMGRMGKTEAFLLYFFVLPHLTETSEFLTG